MTIASKLFEPSEAIASPQQNNLNGFFGLCSSGFIPLLFLSAFSRAPLKSRHHPERSANCHLIFDHSNHVVRRSQCFHQPRAHLISTEAPNNSPNRAHNRPHQTTLLRPRETQRRATKPSRHNPRT